MTPAFQVGMSIERVICYVDLSPSSQRGARLAGAIAKSHGADIEIVHAPVGKPLPLVEGNDGKAPILPPEAPMPFFGRAAGRLRRRIRRLRSMMRKSYPEDQLQTTELSTPSARSLVHHAYRSNADLIVVANEHTGVVDSLLHSSMASKVARQAPCPVLTVTPESSVTPTMRHVLVGVDFSNESVRALESACDIVGPGGKISVLRVWPKPAFESRFEMNRETASEFPGTPIDLACAGELARLQELIASSGRSHIHFEPWVCTGHVDEELARFAREHDADALVVGSREPAGMGERVFGTLTDRLIDEADRPVVTVPQASRVPMMMHDHLPN